VILVFGSINKRRWTCNNYGGEEGLGLGDDIARYAKMV